jgi:uncharacterized membrane protein YeaQ/YmgE (transglycosylase-associated protein family)
MSILAWSAIGSAVGILGSMPIRRSWRTVLADVGLGIVGAISLGWLFVTFRLAADSRPTPGSMLFAMLGSVVTLALYHSVSHARSPRNRS